MKKLYTAISVSTALVTIAIVTATPVIAQQPAGAGRSSMALEEIIVTARKREERLQDTPISVTAFSSSDLEKLSVQNVSDVARYTPNLATTTGPIGGNSGFYFIRGVGQVDGNPANDPGVGTYLDGVYLGRITGASFDTLDIARIEVLRGPQGTLFGRNTIGGAVNVVTSDPGEEFGLKARITGGSRDRLEGRIMMDMPMTEDLSGRLSALYKHQDGWGERITDGTTYGDNDTIAGRAKLLWRPTEDFQALFSADYSDLNGSGLPTVLRNINLAGGMASPVPGLPNLTPLGVPFLPQLPGQVTNDNFKVLASQEPINDVETWGASATLDYDFAGFHIKSITSYRELDSANAGDFDGGGFQFYDLRSLNQSSQFSQEIQLSGLAFQDRLNWLLGFNYFDEEIDYTNSICMGTNIGIPFVPVGVPYDGRCLRNNQTFNLQIESWAVFGHLVYDLTERLAATFGFRYTTDEKTQSYDFFVDNTAGVFSLFQFPPPFPPGIPANFLPGTVQPTFSPRNPFVGIPTVYNNDWSEFTPRFGVDYQLTDDVMLFASYSKGYKSGGFNGRPTPNATGMFGTVQPYNPELVDTIEFGVKSEWWDNRLRLNMSGFVTTYEDIQQLVVGPTGFFETFNAAEAEVNGFEVEIQARPVSELDVIIGVGYMDAQYEKLLPASIAAGITLDDDLPNSPEWTFNAGLQYAWNLPDNYGSFTLRGDYSYQSAVTYNATDEAFEGQDGYGLLNIRGTWMSLDEKYSLSIFGLNVTDEEYFTYGQDVSRDLGTAVSQIGRPAEWGIELGVSY